MNARCRRLARGLFNSLAALSMLLLLVAIGMALASDHIQRKQLRAGQFEAMWHHDVVIVSFGPPSGQPQNLWSFEAPWVSFEVDRINAPSLGQRLLYTLSATETGLIVAAALLPGMWIFLFMWKHNREAAEQYAL